MTTNAAEIRAGLSHPDHRRRRSLRRARRRSSNEEMLTYLEEMGGREVRDRYAGDTGLTDTIDRARRPPRRTRAGLEGDAVVVGLGDREHARPRDRAPARAALRTPRRDRHRLHDPLSVDDARRTSRSPTTSSSACAAAPRTARSPTSSRRTAIARRSARSSRCSIRSSRSTSSSTPCASSASRPRCSRATPAARSATAARYRLDTFGVDSAFDYDPLWAKCVELGIAPVFHSSLQSHRVTRSATSYVYNHIGGLAASHESLCKSLFLSGVTHRFPTLRFGFLEGGVAWACSLLGDLVGHWEKRNARRHPQRSIPISSTSTRCSRSSSDTATTACAPASTELRAYFSPPERRVPNSSTSSRRPRSTRSPTSATVRPELLLRLRGRRPPRRVGVRRARQPGRRAAPADLRLRHLALGRARHDRAGRGGVRARRGRRDRRARVPRAHVPEPGAAARGDESRTSSTAPSARTRCATHCR